MIDQKIRELIHKEIASVFNKTNFSLNQARKLDGSWITDIDHELTERVERVLSANFPGITIVSEEGQHNIKFPCFILDPVDGTAGLVRGNGECSLSLAFMPTPDVTDSLASGFIAHLFSPFQVHSDQSLPVNKPGVNTGLVSRSEWDKGLFAPALAGAFRELRPMGSIALKLAHMAYGNTAFVATLRPKSIWDIAAGTILLHQAGKQFFVNGQRETMLNQLLWKETLVWGSTADRQWITGE